MSFDRLMTRNLLQALEDGILSPGSVLLAALDFMSEDDVTAMCEINGFTEIWQEEETDYDE